MAKRRYNKRDLRKSVRRDLDVRDRENRGNNYRDDRRTNRIGRKKKETIEIDLSSSFLDEMDELAYQDGLEVNEVIELLLDAYVNGNPDVDIDDMDRVYFRENTRSTRSIRRD